MWSNFVDATNSVTTILGAAGCIFERRELAQIFSIDDYEQNYQSAILLDLYYYTLQFARDSQFSKDQTSAFFSIVKRTHEACTGMHIKLYYAIKIW